MPAAAHRPQVQEEILAAEPAARDERDIPAEDDSWVIEDSDGDRPAELAGLDGNQLDELIAAAPARPPGLAGPGGLNGVAEPGQLAAAAPAGRCRKGLAEPGELAAAAPAGPCRNGPAGLVAGGGPGSGGGSPRAACWTG